MLRDFIGLLEVCRVRPASFALGADQGGQEQGESGEFLAEPVMQIGAEAALLPLDGFEIGGFQLATLGDVVDDAYERRAIGRSHFADGYFGGESRAIPSMADRRTLYDDYRTMVLRAGPPAVVRRRQRRWHERLYVASRQLER